MGDFSNLTLSNASKDEKYKCRYTNEMGTDEKLFKVSARVIQSPLLNIPVISIATTSAVIIVLCVIVFWIRIYAKVCAVLRTTQERLNTTEELLLIFYNSFQIYDD